VRPWCVPSAGRRCRPNRRPSRTHAMVVPPGRGSPRYRPCASPNHVVVPSKGSTPPGSRTACVACSCTDDGVL
jgi:hypothetical protein